MKSRFEPVWVKHNKEPGKTAIQRSSLIFYKEGYAKPY